MHREEVTTTVAQIGGCEMCGRIKRFVVYDVKLDYCTICKNFLLRIVPPRTNERMNECIQSKLPCGLRLRQCVCAVGASWRTPTEHE
mmetsp:Transcript_18670/g.52159  ORF Transcript_18670/g.52159 Transcript_18670/m.52159 type:complete len:87 (+) Transcript_18670:1043-1303(+)